MESVLYVNLSIPSIMGMEANPVDKSISLRILTIALSGVFGKEYKILPDL